MNKLYNFINISMPEYIKKIKQTIFVFIYESYKTL